MSLVFHILASKEQGLLYWSHARKRFLGNSRSTLAHLLLRVRRSLPSPQVVLLYAIGFYLVCSRLGPVVSRVGESAIEISEIKSFLEAGLEKEALQAFKEAHRLFRQFTRVPGPCTRRSSNNSLEQLIMGNRSSSRNVTKPDRGQPAERPHKHKPSDDLAVKKDVKNLDRASPVPGLAEREEKLAENEGEGEAAEKHVEAEVPEARISGEADDPKPKHRHSKPRRFSEVEETISTGDLALLYRDGLDVPHYAIFVQHDECDPNFPLLLIKGKTKPLPLDKFNPSMPRNIHPISAVTRIFYGDYSQVGIRHLSVNEPIHCSKAMELMDQVAKIPFSEREVEVIQQASSPGERSAIISTFMVAHFFKLLDIISADPTTLLPHTLPDVLNLSDPTYVKLPPVKLGPQVTGDPPFLAKLVSGIYPPPEITTKPFGIVADTLRTGDLVLFSGATSSGAIIKFFDHSQFSHVAVVLRAKYTRQLLIWEASTNRAGLVDIETGVVRRGVELLPLRHKVFSGWYNRVAVRRLVDITDEQRDKLYEELLQMRKDFQGRPYEKDTWQMIVSAVSDEGLLSFLRNTHEDLSSLFCSEFVAAVYQRLGLLGTEKLSNEYTPDDFSSNRGTKLNFGRLESEVYIELKLDFALNLDTQTSVY